VHVEGSSEALALACHQFRTILERKVQPGRVWIASSEGAVGLGSAVFNFIVTLTEYTMLPCWNIKLDGRDQQENRLTSTPTHRRSYPLTTGHARPPPLIKLFIRY
jgi:hypothetical protein